MLEESEDKIQVTTTDGNCGKYQEEDTQVEEATNSDDKFCQVFICYLNYIWAGQYSSIKVKDISAAIHAYMVWDLSLAELIFA